MSPPLGALSLIICVGTSLGTSLLPSDVKSFQHCIFSEEVYYQRGLQCFLWRLSMVVGARHRYVIEYVSLLTTISHTATSHCHNITHCHSVFLPRSAIRQHVYCKSDMRWRLSTRCGQTTAYSTAASTSTHYTALHCFALHCFLSSSSHRLPRHSLSASAFTELIVMHCSV